MKPTGETVTIVTGTPGDYDWDGNWVDGTEERIPVPGAVVEDGGGQLHVQPDGTVTQTNMRVLFPKQVDLESGSEVEVRGKLYRVDGEPFDHSSQWGSTGMGGTVAQIVRATG